MIAPKDGAATKSKTADTKEEPRLKRRDFVAPVDVRWCPGCGDYAILNTIQNLFPTLGVPREKFVIVSGIGCSSRFPYYMNTYGFHTIHGRGPAVATGIKVSDPSLSVWLITGDGDGLSIGGNHLLHLLRRNVDVKVLLFNNKIYGLTKGQYSPTSERGMVKKSTPMGSVDHPVNPLCFALASEASFVARTYDTNPKHMAAVCAAAARHKGTCFVEILQNCVIFNDKAWADVSARNIRDDNMLLLESGQPLIFGKEKDKGIRMRRDLTPEVVTIGEDGVTEADVLVHDDGITADSYAHTLARMTYPDYPLPIGVFRAVERPEGTYETQVQGQIRRSMDVHGHPNLQALLMGRDYWEVRDEGQSVAHQSEELKHAALSEELVIMEEASLADERFKSNPLMGSLKTRIESLEYRYGSSRVMNVKPTDPVAKAIALLKEYGLDSVLVVEDGECVGIVTSRDILMKVALHEMDRESTPVTEIMTPRPDMASSQNTVGDAINKMSIGSFRHLPVDRGNKTYGMITVQELLGYVHEQVDS